MSIFHKVKSLAAQNNLSLSELERRLDLSNGQLGKWKTSKPSIDKVQLVADYFDVSIDYLLDREKESYKGEELPEDIRIMQRAAQNMSEEDRKKAIKVFEAFFDNWEDITKDEK